MTTRPTGPTAAGAIRSKGSAAWAGQGVGSADPDRHRGPFKKGVPDAKSLGCLNLGAGKVDGWKIEKKPAEGQLGRATDGRRIVAPGAQRVGPRDWPG